MYAARPWLARSAARGEMLANGPCLAARPVAAGHDDAGPFGGERRRDRLPDPGGGAGDERDLPLETHGSGPYTRSAKTPSPRPDCADGARARRRAGRDPPADASTPH